MPSRTFSFFNVADYYAAGQDIATAINNALLEANAHNGSLVFIPPNLPAGGNFNSAGAGVAIMDFRPSGANLPVVTDNGLVFTGQTSGAGASTGTLTNAPAATNPNHWLKVKVNGVARFIPCW
jgi:hypothetical protein